MGQDVSATQSNQNDALCDEPRVSQHSIFCHVTSTSNASQSVSIADFVKMVVEDLEISRDAPIADSASPKQSLLEVGSRLDFHPHVEEKQPFPGEYKSNSKEPSVQMSKSRRANILWGAFLFIFGTVLLILSIILSTWKEIGISVQDPYIFSMFTTSIPMLITAMWCWLQHFCCKARMNSNRCTSFPGWCLLPLCLSLSWLIPLIWTSTPVFTLNHHPNTNTVLFGALSVISLCIGIIGLCIHCMKCKVNMSNIGQIVSISFSVGCCLFDVASDVMAALKVYRHHDFTFCMLSITFCGITFLFYWIIGIIAALDIGEMVDIFLNHDSIKMDHFRSKWRWTLYFPVLSMITITVHFPGTSLIALAFSSFPQYIVSVSFILEHGIVDIFNVLSLSMSLFQLLTSPLITSMIAYCSLTDKVQKQKWLKPGFLCLLCISYVLVFVPVLTLEVIHFFPVLFERYIYHGIDHRNVIFYLIMFNVPKFIFLLMRTGNDIDTKSAAHFLMDRWMVIHRAPRIRNKTAGIAEFVAWFIVYGLTTLVLPLVPAAIVCCISMLHLRETVEKQNNNGGACLFGEFEHSEIKGAASRVRCNVLILFVYLVVAYGSMAGMFVVNRNNGVGVVTFWLLIASWALCLWVLLLPLIIAIVMMVHENVVRPGQAQHSLRMLRHLFSR